jgi:hypothetical protein
MKACEIIVAFMVSPQSFGRLKKVELSEPLSPTDPLHAVKRMVPGKQ